MKTLVTALLMTAAVITGANAAYWSQDMIDAITTQDVDYIVPSDPGEFLARISYLAGFALHYDARCDFLPTDAFNRIATTVKRINEDGGRVNRGAREMGTQDADEFLRKNRCLGSLAKSARRTIEAIWINRFPPATRPGM